jgi:hypothetical protein
MLSVFEKPNVLLRLEGLAVFILALALYRQLGHGWTLFWSTVLLPDVALLGYLANARVGARLYNLTHAKLLPAALAAAGLLMGIGLPVALALIWFVHIGVDRMLGYGLKYPQGFKATHLGEIGSFRRGEA